MHLLSILVILCSATSLVFTKPYQYSYYLSLPGHYQGLEVRDGSVIVNNAPPFSINSGPGFRQGRVGPAFNQNPGLDRQFPIDARNPEIPNFNSVGLTPGLSQNPGFDERFPVIPGNQIRPGFGRGELNPNFNQYPSFGRRVPNSNEPDFSRGRDPDNEEIPDGELDSQLNPRRQFPWNSNRPDFRNGRFNPDNIPYAELDPQFSRGGSNSPQFGNRIQPLIPRQRGISRMTLKPQEIDEQDNRDREEVTTQQPCTFCGVHKINPMDGIDGNIVNPDSESVEPKNVSGPANPGFVIRNNAGTPATVDIPPGYLLNSPFVTYYAVASL